MKKVGCLIILIGIVLISTGLFISYNDNSKIKDNENNSIENNNSTDNTDYEDLVLYKNATLKSNYVKSTTFNFPEELQCSTLNDSKFNCNNFYKYNNDKNIRTRISIEGKIVRYSQSIDEILNSNKKTASYYPDTTVSDYDFCKDNMRCYRSDYIEKEKNQNSKAYLCISFPDDFYIDANISVFSTEYPDTKQVIDEYLESFIKSTKIEN